jgi:hypothetical protein
MARVTFAAKGPEQRLTHSGAITRAVARALFARRMKDLNISMLYCVDLAEPEGFEPSIGLYKPITV